MFVFRPRRFAGYSSHPNQKGNQGNRYNRNDNLRRSIEVEGVAKAVCFNDRAKEIADIIKIIEHTSRTLKLKVELATQERQGERK